VLVCVGAELGFRMLSPRTALANKRLYLLTGVLTEYEPRAYTNFQRPRNTKSTNALGFSDVAWSTGKTPGVPRILCLGGSTTESGNGKGRLVAYPYLLELVLEERTGRDFEVMNAGISGWTTAEMLVSWFLTLRDFDPDVLVLHEAVNDVEPRFLANFQPDYSHWRRPIQPHPVGTLESLLVRCSDLYVFLRLRAGYETNIMNLTSKPGPREPLMSENRLPFRTSVAFRRNIASIARDARADGHQVLLMTLPTGPEADTYPTWCCGIEQNNKHLRYLAEKQGYLLADAALAFQARPELQEHFIDLVHLDPEGNQAKAELIADALQGWLAQLSPEGARSPKRPLLKRLAIVAASAVGHAR